MTQQVQGWDVSGSEGDSRGRGKRAGPVPAEHRPEDTPRPPSPAPALPSPGQHPWEGASFWATAPLRALFASMCVTAKNTSKNYIF